MTGEHLAAQARRVVVGQDEQGRAVVVEDDVTATRLAGPGNTKCDIWRVEQIPSVRGAGDGLNGKVVTQPPPRGLVHRVVTFPPDAEWDRSQGYADANGSLPKSISEAAAGGIKGMHATDSFDILTVIRGELHLVLETGETCLRQGDSLIMDGAPHAWSNKTSEPVTVVTVVVSVET